MGSLTQIPDEPPKALYCGAAGLICPWATLRSLSRGDAGRAYRLVATETA